MEFKFQSQNHQQKRLQCQCGSWDWKVEAHIYMAKIELVCASCGETADSAKAEDMVREFQQEAE